LACAIDKRLFEPHFILLNDRRGLFDDQYGAIEGVKIHVVPARRSWDPRRLTDLARLLRDLRPDLVHAVLPAANLWGLWAARCADIRPCIGSLRGLRLRRTSRWYWIDRICLKHLAHVVVVNSDTIRENCIRDLGIRPDKIHRIYNGIRISPPPQADRAEVLRLLGVTAVDRPVLSALCRLDANKSVATILSAVRLVLDRGRPVTLIGGGTGPLLEDLQSQTRRLGLKDYVRFPGQIRDVPRLLACTDLFISASRSEGFENGVLEAMACGTVVIASDISAHREIIRPDENGWLFEPGNPQSLADAVVKALDNPESRRLAAERARAEVASRFNLETMVNSFQDFYRRLHSEIRS
jgi:glycosyltransferase involved in cell wall biosynthesis